MEGGWRRGERCQPTDRLCTRPVIYDPDEDRSVVYSSQVPSLSWVIMMIIYIRGMFSFQNFVKFFKILHHIESLAHA
jgi:hypothetical protein